MSIQIRSRQGMPRRAALVLMTAAVLAAAVAAPAQPVSASPDTEVQQRLKTTIESQFRALATQGGVLLIPRRADSGVESIEVLEHTIAVNGRVVTGAELRERLGAGADAVIELTYLEPAARRTLLFGPAPEAAPPPPPAQVAPEAGPPAPRPDQPRRRRSDARVRIGGSVTVGEDEVVDGSVVAVMGSATVRGEVSDEVVVVLGDVHLGPAANVHGDVTVVGGQVDVDPQARIGGRVNEIAFDIPRIHWRPFQNWNFRRPFPAWWFSPSFDLFASSLRMLLIGLLAMMALLLAGRPIEAIERRVGSDPWRSGLVGLLAQLLFVPLLVLTVVILAVSIIGIPLLLLVPFALLALLAALLVGFAGVACRLGRVAQQRFGLSPENRYVVLLIGLVAIWALTLAGHAIGLGGRALWALAAPVGVIGFLVEYAAWTVGFGAAILTRFGTRPGLPPAPVAQEADLGPPPTVDPSLTDLDLK